MDKHRHLKGIRVGFWTLGIHWAITPFWWDIWPPYPLTEGVQMQIGPFWVTTSPALRTIRIEWYKAAMSAKYLKLKAIKARLHFELKLRWLITRARLRRKMGRG